MMKTHKEIMKIFDEYRELEVYDAIILELLLDIRDILYNAYILNIKIPKKVQRKR
jgi:hypothetical protein